MRIIPTDPYRGATLDPLGDLRPSCPSTPLPLYSEYKSALTNGPRFDEDIGSSQALNRFVSDFQYVILFRNQGAAGVQR